MRSMFEAALVHKFAFDVIVEFVATVTSNKRFSRCTSVYVASSEKHRSRDQLDLCYNSRVRHHWVGFWRRSYRLVDVRENCAARLWVARPRARIERSTGARRSVQSSKCLKASSTVKLKSKRYITVCSLVFWKDTSRLLSGSALHSLWCIAVLVIVLCAVVVAVRFWRHVISCVSNLGLTMRYSRQTSRDCLNTSLTLAIPQTTPSVASADLELTLTTESLCDRDAQKTCYSFWER